MKKLIIILLGICFASNAFTQDYTKKELKYLQKVEKFYEKQKYEKSLDFLFRVIDEHAFNSDLWDMAVSISYQNYQYLHEKEMNNLYEQIMDQIESKKKKEDIYIEFKSFGSKQAKQDFLNICYVGSLKSKSNIADMYVRTFFIEDEVDTAVSEDAEDYFKDAEEHFAKGEYEEALEDYEDALLMEPDYYLATLHLGDAYYVLEDYENAIIYFKKAIDMQPNLLQPRKYITDAYFRNGDTEKALEECINGILIYPDQNMFDKLEDIADKLGYTYRDYWLPRLLVPNIADADQETDNEEFLIYRKAKDEIIDYCDTNGIIRENPITKEKYLETYSWKTLMDEMGGVDFFETSFDMADDGYLDCYLLISLFHVSLYEQFRYLVENDREKAKKYIYRYYLSRY